MEETVKLARTAGGTCYGYVCDLCDKEDIYKKAELVKKEVGKVRIALWNEEREVIQILLQSIFYAEYSCISLQQVPLR